MISFIYFSIRLTCYLTVYSDKVTFILIYLFFCNHSKYDKMNVLFKMIFATKNIISWLDFENNLNVKKN